MNNEFYMWGERGLVATLFQDICASGAESDRWLPFLERIGYSVGGRRLTDAWCVVEPDFGNKGFGHPDAVFQLTFNNEDRVVFFLEAKLRTFQKASWPEIRRYEKQFNSTINGQIELNHRLALALRDFEPQVSTSLVEPDWILGTPYSTAIPGVPRRVKKRIVLEQLASRLAGLAIDGYVHIAITTDSQSPLQSVSEGRRPRMFSDVRNDAWENYKDRICWGNWRTMYELAKNWPGSSFCKTYEFFEKSFAATELPTGGVPQGFPSSGVRLVALNPTLYPASPPTYLHLSWNNRASYRIRDYSGPVRRDIHLDCDLTTIVGNIEDYKEYPRRQRRAVEDYEWWNREVLALNRQKWPSHWPSL